MIETMSYYSTILYKDFVKYTTDQLEEHGLHFGSMFFIIYIGKHAGCTPSELTKQLKLDWGHSQRTINKLEEDGFILKEKKGRSYELSLTDKGKETFEVSHRVFYEWDEEYLSPLTKEERSQLLGLLKKVVVERSE